MKPTVMPHNVPTVVMSGTVTMRKITEGCTGLLTIFFSKCLKTSKEKEELICWSRKLFLTVKGYQVIKYYMIPSKDIHKIHVIIVLLVTSIVWSSGLQTASHLNTSTNEVGVIVSILPVQNGIRKIIHLFACFWDYNLITTFLHSLSSL